MCQHCLTQADSPYNGLNTYFELNTGFLPIAWKTLRVNLLIPAGAELLFLLRDATQGNAECVHLLLMAGAAQGHADRAGRTPLHLACSHGQLGAVHTLLAGIHADPFVEDAKGDPPPPLLENAPPRQSGLNAHVSAASDACQAK